MKLKVVVLAGGKSSEREVSLRSGQACFNALNQLDDVEASLMDIQSPNHILKLEAMKPDLAFLVTHGDFGEDGRLQGLLDWLEIPYTGSSAAASSLCMDKYLSKLLFRKSGLPTSEACLNIPGLGFKEMQMTLNSERLFMKTRSGGSSIGAQELKTQAELNSKSDQPCAWMIEPLIVGRELTLGYLQQDGEWLALPILELKAKKSFYDYEAKYTEGMTEFVLPAPMGEARRESLEQMGKVALERCGVSGYARVDMIVSENDVHILEINTLPGMTSTSDLPAMAKEAGIGFNQLVEVMMREALAIHQSKRG